MVSGLRRGVILQLCIFQLRYSFKENLLHLAVSATVLSWRIKPWLFKALARARVDFISVCMYCTHNFMNSKYKHNIFKGEFKENMNIVIKFSLRGA